MDVKTFKETLKEFDNTHLTDIIIHSEYYEEIMRFENPTKLELFLDGFHNFWNCLDCYNGGAGQRGMHGAETALPNSAGMTNNNAPNGGKGVQNSILGPAYWWAGGGGGSGYSDGSITIVSTQQGGSSGIAQIIFRLF